ncbi:MAG: RIP metalloprotease RseP [Clostridiales Family XIII bacterium]|jgi:regulator of sigma E protease|nr:RIP metalloprotease RseP [Clostridiales Family XIII bacterium]
MTIVYAIIIFLLLIFVHETGHFLTAKAMGIQVNEFALGMGPKIFSVQKGETKYSLRWIPVGGYCAMEGEDEESVNPRAFGNKSAPVRALVLFAGSLMNVVLAIVLLSMVIFAGGEPTRSLDTVLETAPAYADGLRSGDEILSIDGIAVSKWADISEALVGIAELSPAAPAQAPAEAPEVQLQIRRGGEEHIINTHFYRDEAGVQKIGITPAFSRSFPFFFKSFGYGAQATVGMARMMYEVLGDLVTGQAGMDQLTGPIGIVKTVGDSARYGFIYLVQLTALISLNLGIVNLLPFPALDGGRLIFLLIRKVTGRAITDKIEGRVHLVGILVLFGFMALITVQDISRFLLPGG